MCVLTDGIMLGFLSYCGICDLESRDIPIWLMVLYSVVTVIATIFCGEENLGSVAAGFVLGLLFIGISKITKEAIGYGDSWIITLLGIYLGVERLLGLLLIASTCAGIVSLFKLWRNHWRREETLPFVPYLAAAFIGVVLA